MSKALWINFLLNYASSRTLLIPPPLNLILFQRISLNSEQLRLSNLFFTEVRCEVQEQSSDQIRADFVGHHCWPGKSKKGYLWNCSFCNLPEMVSSIIMLATRHEILQLHAPWLPPSPKVWARECISQASFVPSLCNCLDWAGTREKVTESCN